MSVWRLYNFIAFIENTREICFTRKETGSSSWKFLELEVLMNLCIRLYKSRRNEHYDFLILLDLQIVIPYLESGTIWV